MSFIPRRKPESKHLKMLVIYVYVILDHDSFPSE